MRMKHAELNVLILMKKIETSKSSCTRDGGCRNLRRVRVGSCVRFQYCVAPSGEEYATHHCTSTPLADKSIMIACQEEKVRVSKMKRGVCGGGRWGEFDSAARFALLPSFFQSRTDFLLSCALVIIILLPWWKRRLKGRTCATTSSRERLLPLSMTCSAGSCLYQVRSMTPVGVFCCVS